MPPLKKKVNGQQLNKAIVKQYILTTVGGSKVETLGTRQHAK